jgi:MFS family permease
LLRRNFGFDAAGAIGTGLFNALVVNFLSVIARREGADPLLLAALAAAPFAANTMAIFFGACIPREQHRVRYVSCLMIVGRAIFIGGAFSTGPVALLAMGLGMWLTMAIAAPLQVDIWRGTYPQRVRGRVLGYLRVLQTSAGAIAAPLAGLLIERFGHGPMLGIGALLGMLGAAGYSRVKSQPIAASHRFTPGASLRLLAEQPMYRTFVMAWVIWGFGSFMVTPLYALVLVDRFQASYSDVGLLQLAGAFSGLLAYLVLGQLLDRGGAGLAYRAAPLGFLLVSVVPLVYLLAPSLPFLALGYVLQAVGTSANDLGWQVALISRIPDEHRLRYQAAHTSITGVRGVAAPFVGSLVLVLGGGIGPVLVLGGALGVAGAYVMARALGIEFGALRLFRAVLGNTGRPPRDVLVGHGIVGQGAGVQTVPTLDVNQVLLARQERAMADPVAGRGGAHRSFQAADQLLHDPMWQPVAFAGVNKPKQDEVRQQYAPVPSKSA